MSGNNWLGPDRSGCHVISGYFSLTEVMSGKVRLNQVRSF